MDPTDIEDDVEIEAGVFTLELLHAADQEAGLAAIEDAPRFSAVLNALRAEDVAGDGVEDNTLTLSSGDAFIPGLFYNASIEIFGAGGVADILIQNELGFQAIAFGNHEFDFDTLPLSELIAGTAGTDPSFTGTAFPYLSGNLDFSTDAFLADLVVPDGGAPMANSIAGSVVLETGGELIGVVGATTPTLGTISSPGGVTVLPPAFGATPTPAELDALAAEIQTDVDALLAANPDMDKVIVLAHMQRIDIEQALATRLTDVDVIVAGGSNTRLFDENDRPRDGDSVQGEYPIFLEDAGGDPVAVVNTDGSYKYVGRLVLDFDADGLIVPESYDAAVSGAFATDDEGVADLDAEGLVDPEIQALADAVAETIVEKESNLLGVSEVFLNGNRSGAGEPGDPDGVRTQETNLGNLTADANLALAKEIDSSVTVSIKNGGGLRASIGQFVVPPGGSEAERLPNEEIPGVKPAGGISQSDVETSLSFNNGLTLLTVTRAELLAVLENGVSAVEAAEGRFAQVAGVEFSFDPDLPAGERIVSAAIVDADGAVLDVLAQDGAVVGDPDGEVRVVTLGFLADGGDFYPFPDRDRVDLDLDETAPRTGDADFAADGTEQDALAEYLLDNFLATPFDAADVGPELDERIQNLNFRADTVLEGAGPTITRIYEIQGASQLSPLVLAASGFATVPQVFDNLPGSNVAGPEVTTAGVVTAVDTNGFYLQDPEGDGRVATSDAIFVFTGAAPTVAVGDALELTGTVSEFYPGGSGTRNLPTTQISGVSDLVVVSSGNAPPAAQVVGNGGRIPPSANIEDDAFVAFNPTTSGADFFESLEGMRVTYQDVRAVAGTSQFGEIYGVVDQGAAATGLSERGTLNISPDDFNPERVQIQGDFGVGVPQVDTGDLLGDVTGVLSYGFGNFELLATEDFADAVSPGGLAPETTTLAGDAEHLTIASYNVLNLDPNDDEIDEDDRDSDVADFRFGAVAAQIVNNLAAPDIIGLQEIQDNSGGDDDGVTSANETLELLTRWIDFLDDFRLNGSLNYEYVDNTFITDGASGGQPGGNIRTAYLYRTDRVDLVEGSVATIGGQGTDEAFFDARLPLAADFAFGGEVVTVVNNHFSSKGGSAPILGTEQPFEERQEDPTVNGSLSQRQAQAAAVGAFAADALAEDAAAKLVVLGDFNEFEFVSPLRGLEAAGLKNLINTLDEDERYTFNFDGNSQSLDHVLVSELLAADAEFDIVHVNSEFAADDFRASDHDPVLTRLRLDADALVAEAAAGCCTADALM